MTGLLRRDSVEVPAEMTIAGRWLDDDLCPHGSALVETELVGARSLRGLVLAVAVLLIFAGLKTLTMLILGIGGGVVVCVVAVYWFLTTRGFLRWLSLAVAVLTPIVVLTFLVRERLLWVVLLAIGLFVVAGIFARTALEGGRRRNCRLSSELHRRPSNRSS